MMRLVLVGLLQIASGANVLESKVVALRPSFLSVQSKINIGNVECMCIGLNNIQGKTVAQVKVGEETKEVAMPADLGARCEAWDQDNNPECKGEKKPDWCEKQWCYVDPCKCNIETMPKESAYVPEATYLNRPIYYSYATCGATDTWAEKLPEIGSHGCRCIGFKDAPGTTEVMYKDKKVVFPGDLGASCEAWDETKNPDCLTDDPKKAPDWCHQKWCYVDPCSCTLPIAPKLSAYVKDATFQGRSVFYSYATCGGVDSWTAENHKEACVNRNSKSTCEKLEKCAWVQGRGCIGWELAHACPMSVGWAAAQAQKESKSGASRVVGRFLPLVAVLVATFTK